jgi:TetR/AcrR family transcriptional regulator
MSRSTASTRASAGQKRSRSLLGRPGAKAGARIVATGSASIGAGTARSANTTAVNGERLRSQQGSRHQPELTRAAILDAAVKEFAHEGVAGARTDAIARAAGVNKALLYYYFKDKEALYGAVLDRVFAGLLERVTVVLDAPTAPREKLLNYLGTHFDYIAQAPLDPRLIQHEMMRAGRNASPHLRHIVKSYFFPLFERLSRLIREGIASGDFREVDPQQFVPSMIAVIVFYFSNTPVVRFMIPGDPLSAERLAERRAAVLDFISSALFRPAPDRRSLQGWPSICHAKGAMR